MGMFDYVKVPKEYDLRCSSCGGKVTNFQTKFGDCTLDTIDAVRVPYFNGYCSTCGERQEYKVIVQEVSSPFAYGRFLEDIEVV